MRIILCCGGGFSTSILAKRMRAEAETRGIDCTVEAFAEIEMRDKMQDCDVCLIGPQISYYKDNLQKIASKYGTRIAVIPNMIYGMMKGDEALDQALSLISNEVEDPVNDSV